MGHLGSFVLTGTLIAMSISASVACSYFTQTPQVTTLDQQLPNPSPITTDTLNQLPHDHLASVSEIIDPSNLGWPREIEGLNGRVIIPSKPERIITASVGHDEMTLALVPRNRLVGVGGATKSQTYSNVANLVQNTKQITRDPEVIVAQEPDVIVTSPFFQAEAIRALTRLGIPTIQTALANDHQTRVQSILLLGYIYGEDQRASELAKEIEERYTAITNITSAKPVDTRPRVLALTRYSDKFWVGGIDSTEDRIILAAGGHNVAAEAGIKSNSTTSLEGVISMAPEVIIIAQPIELGAEQLQRDLLNNPALAQLAAIKEKRVYLVKSSLFTTLSFWNIMGIEQLAKLLWPDDFIGIGSKGFSSPRE